MLRANKFQRSTFNAECPTLNCSRFARRNTLLKLFDTRAAPLKRSAATKINLAAANYLIAATL
jgi:hypothetical protein